MSYRRRLPPGPFWDAFLGLASGLILLLFLIAALQALWRLF